MTPEKIAALVDLLGHDAAQRMLAHHDNPAYRAAWKSYQAQQHTFKDAAGLNFNKSTHFGRIATYKAAAPAAPATPDRARAQRALDRLYAQMGDAAVADLLDAYVAQVEQQAAAQKRATKAAQAWPTNTKTVRARSAEVDDVMRRAGGQ